MNIDIGISEPGRKAVSEILGHLLADEYLLYTKTRNYHWNVVGPQFNDLHKFFEAQYSELNQVIDDVAERARTLGGPALGTLAEFTTHARLTERPGVYPDATGMIEDLLRDHEALVRQLRQDLDACAAKHGDMGTSDFLTALMEQHEKMAWMLRAFLGRSPA